MPVSVRVATVADARAISIVQVETWRAAYDGLMDPRILERLDVERNAARRIQTWEERHADARVVDLVAETEADGGVVGWACVGPTDQDDLPGWGQLLAIYALERTWSSGVGHALLVAAEGALRDAGFAHATLLVLDGNDRAARFYERHGWRADGHTWVDDRFTPSWPAEPLVEHRRIRDLAEQVTA